MTEEEFLYIPEPMSFTFLDVNRTTKLGERSERCLLDLKRELGLEDILHTWDQPFFIVEQKFTLFWNPNCTGEVHIGKKDKNLWIAQVSLKTKDRYQEAARYLFSRLPIAQDVIEANVLNQLYCYFLNYDGNDEIIHCENCGSNKHWLDCDGNIEMRLQRLKARECGCA